jgi:hypothetical protein
VLNDKGVDGMGNCDRDPFAVALIGPRLVGVHDLLSWLNVGLGLVEEKVGRMLEFQPRDRYAASAFR